MNTFLFIMVTILLVGFRAYKSKLNRMTDQEDPSEPVKAAPKSTFESLFDVHVEEPNPSESVVKGNMGSYFSYESADESDACEVCTTAEGIAKTGEGKNDSNENAIDFDLRQAVISQTILSNKYLDEMHSIDN